MAILKQLGIDPAVLTLQIIAFAMLFWLLRRFLFRPVLGIMQEREKEIAEALDAGERAKAELARIDQEKAQVLAEAREEGREQVRRAVREGEQARERILAETREDAHALRERAQQAIALEREEAKLALRHQVVDLALAAASRAVLRRLDEQVQRQVVDDFISSLERQQ
jgi:F-type H+-transporting ATPase subunit b